MSAHSVRSYVNRSVFVIAMLLVASLAWAVPGDINESGRVDGFDLMAFSRAYGTSSADEAWNPMADLNGDGTVDEGDLAILKQYFGIEGKSRGCWVLDIDSDSVVLLGSTSGNPVREYTFDSQPREMAYNPVADELWITFSNRELKIVGESENGTRVERTITGFPYPYHVDVDAINGGCWVTDTNLDDVYFIADDVPDGYDVATDQGFHRTVQGFSDIKSLAVSAKDGSVWVGDAYRDTVYKIERDVPDGYDITSRFDFHAFTTGFGSPDSLAVNGVTGDCWVADSYTHKVVRIASKGNQWLTTIDITSPVAVTVNPLDGTIHVGDNNRKEIVKYLKNGLIEGFRTPCVYPNYLSGEHVTGALWAAYNGTYSNNSLLKISSAGNVLLSVEGYQPRRVIVVQETDPAMGKRPHALFSANATGLDVQFDAGASYDLDGQIIRYEWDFDGDGTFETTTSSEKVSHTYTLPGVYTPILKVTDNDWLTDTKSDVILQLGSFTVTAQVEPSNGTTMQTAFSFSGKGIDPAHGQIQNYKWDFDGDGQPDFFSETTASTTHSYAEPGKYTATLIAVNAQGESASAAVQVEVSQAPPVITNAYTSPESGNAPLRTWLQGEANDPDGSIALFQWDFNGDGQFNWSNMGTGRVNTVFFDNGTYAPLFKVTDNSGLTAEQTASLVVNPMPVTGVTPVARFSVDKVKDNAPATFTFDASDSIVSAGEIVSYDWNFGNYYWKGNGETTSYEYLSGGTYTVTLTVTTDRGATASTSQKVTVRDEDLPIALFDVSDQEGLVPLTVDFDASASRDNGAITSYDWNFTGSFFDDMESGAGDWQAEGDWALTTKDAYSGTHCWTDTPGGDYNSSAQTALVSPSFSIPQGINAQLKFLHKYYLGNAYSYYTSYAKVQISSDGGQTWNTLRTFNGYDQDDWKYEKVDISSSYSGKSDLKFRFYLDARGYTGDGWYIDDVTIDGGVTGYDGSGKNPTHTYEKAGTFNPVLRVTDDEGNEDFFAVPIKAKTPPTVTILDPTNLYDISMRNILFSGTGRDPDGTIVLYEWDFNGDGIFDWSSTNQGTTLHDLDINGTYTAMFRVTDNDGLTGNATVAFNTVAMPPANLQAGVERTSRDTFAFTGFAQDGDGHIVKYEWDFDGDGNPDWGSAGPGKVVSFTSQYNTSSRAAKNLIDGKIKESDSNGWSSTGAPVVPQEIVFELAGNQVWSVDALRVNPATTGGTDRWAKEIQVLVSSTGLRANDFSLVSESGTFVLANEDRFQIFGFDPVQARYVKLRVLSNYGNSAEVQLGEFDVLSGHLSLLSPLTASTSHQYATPGEYTAVLKATDDEGLVATIDAKSVKSLPDDQIQAAVSALPDPVATGQAISLRGFGVYDDFSNSTTIGTRWTSPTDLNDWTIIDGQLRQNTDNGGGPEKLNYGRYVVAGNATWQDYVLRARIYSTDNDSMGLIVRYQNEGAYYLFEWNRQSSCRRLLKRTANATEILAEDAVGYEYNQWYEINVDVQGSRIRVEVDGNQVFDVTDSSYGQGKVGLWSNYNRYTYFDDISLTWPEISKYEWDFEGDGIYDWSSTTIGSTVHSYDLPTLYEPIFRLTDTQGRTETIQKSIQVVAAADTAPYAWVIDKYNHRIVQLDALGERILKTVQGFSYPGAIDVDWKDGTIWVCDASNYRVVRLDASVPDGYDLRYDRGHHAVFTNYSDLNTHSPETLVVNQSTGDCTTLWNYSEITTMPADADSRELGIPLQGTVSACGSGAPVGQVYGEYNNTDGALGKGLYLGDGSYLKLPHTTLDGRGDFAFELWFKTPTSPTRNMSLVSGAALDNDNAFLLDLSKDGTQIYLYAMGDSTTFDIPGVNNDQFHHLAFVRSNSTGTLYIDGTASGSQSMTNASLTIDPGGLIIGQEQDQVGGRFDRYNQLKGWVDDIRVWSRALSSEEIDTNKDKALTGTESGLVGYWSCDTVTPAQDNVRVVSGFSNPVAIDVRNVDQSLWVADSLTDKVFHILANATLRYDVTTQTDSHFEWAGLSVPVGLAVDQNDGSCWVGDSGRDRVYKFDSQANKLLELRADANYVDVDQKDSSVWFSDSTAKEIFHCDASGTKAGSSVLSGATISSLAVDPTTGICWLTDTRNSAVIRLAPGGGLLSENTGFNNPVDVAVPSMCLQDDPPVIDSASADVSEGTGETLVTFSADVSDNTGVTFYQWDFNGDGRVDYSSATSGDTSYTYTEPGLYRPVLTVIDGEGNTGSTTLEPVIIGPGYATIEVDKSSGPASLTVKFTGSGFDPKGGMLEYAWDSDNDGTFDYVSQSFSKTFYDSGEYPVLLRVKGNSGYFYDQIVISVLSSPPTVSCSATPVSGEPPLVVKLKGSASDADGSLVLYQWDFESDGIFDWSSSTSTEVDHVYTKAGIYTPVFRAVDDDGDMATAMKAIIVNSLPKAAFSLNATRGNAPMAVTAQATTSSDVDGNITDYTWYLDGTQTGQGEQAVFSGLTAGIHTIKLKVVDAYGETSETEEEIEVLAAGMPIAVAGVAEDEVIFPESVSLRGDASTDNGTIVSHEWQYGLGYYLDANGYPTHQLLIGKWDSSNCNDFSKHIQGMENSTPYPGRGVDGRTWIEADDEDGNFDWNEKLGSSYNDFGYSHIYVYAQEEQNARILFGADDAARFWVNQELVYTKDTCGGVVIDSHQADIFLKQGWNRILAQVVNGSSGWGLAYRLVDANDNPLHLPYSLIIPSGVPDYSGQGANLDRGYPPGRYTAELTVTDNQNNTDSNEVSFTVLPPDGGGVIEALVDPVEADAPFTAQFDATIDSSITPTLYEWDFDGDMVFDVSSTESVQTEHVFREKALINVTLHVRDSQGNDHYDSVEINAGGITPVAIPVAYPTKGTAPLRVKFSTNGYDADNTINRYEWDFNGDGIFDKFVTPGETLSNYPDYQPIAMTTEYTYHAPGTYNATLKVTDHDGYSSSANITIVVQAAEAPELALKADTTSGEAPLTVNFRAEAMASTSSIAGYRWDFGEGNGFGDLQAESLVSHTYVVPGIYTAQVMAEDDSSASSTRGLTIFVLEDGAPGVTATVSEDSGEGDLAVILDAQITVSEDDPVVMYEWDFDGNGEYDWSSADSPTVGHIYADPGMYDAVLKTTTQSGKVGYDQLNIAVEPSFKVWRGKESFDPTLGETMPLVLATSMEMKLLDFNVIDRVGTLVKQLDANKMVSPGIYNYTWDGRDTAGNIVGSGVFYFIARYEINGKVYEFDLTNSEGFDRRTYGDHTDGNNYQTSFNPFSGEPLDIRLELPKPAEVCIYVYDWNSKNDIRTILLREPMTSGSKVVQWDGAQDDGTLISSSTSYTMSMSYWILSDNAMIVQSRPQVSQLLTYPHYFNPSFNPYLEDPSLSIDFSLSKSSDVLVHIVDGFNTVVRVIEGENLPAGANTLHWDGRNEKGLLPMPGFYRARIKAKDKAGNESIPFNSIFNLFY